MKLLFLAALAATSVSAASKGSKVETTSATEYLGQYTYFRGWTNRRRMLIVKGDDDVMNSTLERAVYEHRCDMAVRRVNLGEWTERTDLS